MSNKITREGRRVSFEVPVYDKFDRVEMRIHSRRNNPVSRLSDISPKHPFPEKVAEENAQYEHDLLFPFVDLVPMRGLNMRFEFPEEKGEYCFNTGYCKTLSRISKNVEIDSGDLLAWENDIFISDVENLPKDMYLYKNYYPVVGKIVGHFDFLSDWFEGTLEFWGIKNDEQVLISRDELEADNVSETPGYLYEAKELEDDLLEDALKEIVENLFRARNHQDDELIGGGLYLFYDRLYHAFRAGHWNWTWGPVIQLLLEIADEYGTEYKEELIDYAKSLGNTILRFQYPEGGNEFLSGVNLTRWQNNLRNPNCVIGYYSIADSGFAVKWGLGLLYRMTGDKKYLDSMVALAEGAAHWLDHFEVIPSDYEDDNNRWTHNTLDETMFGVGMYTELYDITKDEKYMKEGKRYFESIIKVLDMGNGMWSRSYLQKEKVNEGFKNDTKGHGWAMDGLLCAYDLYHDPRILQKACDTADLLIANQNSDGSFGNFFATEVPGGVGEKSTGLWSWLLYRLYAKVNDDKYRDAARRALLYLINHLENGNDDINLRGSLVACSVQSGIIYRAFFDQSCAYSIAFMGLAIMEEMRLRK